MLPIMSVIFIHTALGSAVSSPSGSKRYLVHFGLKMLLVRAILRAPHSRKIYGRNDFYSAPVGVRSIALNLSVCLCVCVSVREHISGTAEQIFTKFLLHISRGRGSVLLWRRCATLCTSGFMDDVTFGRSGPYRDAWKAEPLTYYH